MISAALFDLARLGLGGLLATVGIAFLCGGAIGVLRFPDFYTRIHAASVIAGVGACLVIAALAVTAADLALALRLGLLGALIAVLNPTLTHVAASAAHAAGLAPLAGRYTVPRPGAAERQP